MYPPIDPKTFWEKKILNWERKRYSIKEARESPLESWITKAGASVRFRLDITKQMLSAHIKDKHIVELGCGSGFLASDLISGGAASYTGYDISSNAIKNASKLASVQGLGDKVSFNVCSIVDLPSLNADIVFSLGLFDWLDNDTIANIFILSGRADYLHSFSERRLTLSQYIHRLYVFLAYGWRTKSYVPKYHLVSEIESLACSKNRDETNIFRHRKLSFGTLISSLPLGK